MQAHTLKDTILKKRAYREFTAASPFGSVPGRTIDKWIIHKKNMFEEEGGLQLKRFKSSPVKNTSFTDNYFKQQYESKIEKEYFEEARDK